MSRKHKSFHAHMERLARAQRKQVRALARLRATLRATPKRESHMDETAISAALAAAEAPRYPGDAAQLCSIAEHAHMDSAMLVWWVKVPASRARDWSADSLSLWTRKYSALLSHVTTGDHIAMCEQCHAHPARLMAGVWICSGGCPPLPAAPPTR